MAYFNRKDIVRILAEKPDMISSFPEYVLSARQCDDMEQIPVIALCDITMMSDPKALDALFLSARPDAVLPSVLYCGIERLHWRGFDGIVADLKKTLESNPLEKVKKISNREYQVIQFEPKVCYSLNPEEYTDMYIGSDVDSTQLF